VTVPECGKQWFSAPYKAFPLRGIAKRSGSFDLMLAGDKHTLKPVPAQRADGCDGKGIYIPHQSKITDF